MAVSKCETYARGRCAWNKTDLSIQPLSCRANAQIDRSLPISLFKKSGGASSWKAGIQSLPSIEDKNEDSPQRQNPAGGVKIVICTQQMESMTERIVRHQVSAAGKTFLIHTAYIVQVETWHASIESGVGEKLGPPLGCTRNRPGCTNFQSFVSLLRWAYLPGMYLGS